MSDSTADQARLARWAAGAVLVIVVLWIANWVLKGDDPLRGTWGDMFGGVNALFSGLAFAGIIIAILLQRQELALQRNELRLTREELELTREQIAGQREEMVLQNRTLREQLYESSFLELLSQLRQVAGAIQWPWGQHDQEDLRGAAAFHQAGQRCRIFVVKNPQNDLKASAQAALEEVTQYHQAVGITSYLGFCTETLNWITEAPDDLRERYLRLWSAQLSPGEQMVLVVWALSDEGEHLRRVAAAQCAFRDFNIPGDLREAVGGALSTAFMTPKGAP